MISPQLLRELLRLEIRQLEEEGYDVSAVRARLEEAGYDVRRLMSVYEEMKCLPMRPDFGYEEPTDLSGIRRLRPKGPRDMGRPSSEELDDKVLGAWLGKCIGCMLGKPVEGWYRSKIRERLVKAGEYPLKYYFPEGAFTEEERAERARLLRGAITRVERDDDVDYLIVNLSVYKRRRDEFRTEDVAEEWLSRLPYYAVYTAERAAYRNLTLGLKPPETARFLNPYREWIGAQIRGDFWGYVSPGQPERAAELAYRDAVLSHVKNGVYGEMFVAAMVSAAFVTSDPEEVVRVGLSEIPKTSRLAEAINYALELRSKGVSWEEALDGVVARYGCYHPVHVVNNAAIVAVALLWGEGDFAKSITIAVMGGFDTDCNGATVGSIVGAMKGAKGIPKEWYEPLNDTIRSAVYGYDGSRISELAKETVRLARLE